MSETKIFLSSTFVDLAKSREEISKWITSVFGAELIIMETFGSDTAPPNVVSIKRVNECDIFIGIYAHRYGTVESNSGKSITELELDQANEGKSVGKISDILLYLKDERSSWLRDFEDSNAVAKQGLERLKSKAKKHTITKFNSASDLLLSIVRDVFKRMRERYSSDSLQVRPLALPGAKKIGEPPGMEFLTSEDRDYLVGRKRNTEELIKRIEDESIVLLVGESGVGKTSLIHAGIIPNASAVGMRPIYARPLASPSVDIVDKVKTSIFDEPPPFKWPLVALLARVVTALQGQKVLLIIDQFEDVLASTDLLEVEHLVADLGTFHELAEPDLRVLISYRADLEGRLGEYWQQISGSPRGLARYYISGITEKDAWEGIEKTCQDLCISLKLRPSEESRIIKDLSFASKSIGQPTIYPPYMQMLLDHFWSATNKGGTEYRIEKYQEAGGMIGVVGGYLNRVLKYAQDKEGYVLE